MKTVTNMTGLPAVHIMVLSRLQGGEFQSL